MCMRVQWGWGGRDVIGTTFREKYYISYDAQSTDSDHPWISLRKLRIQALRSGPSIVHAFVCR